MRCALIIPAWVPGDIFPPKTAGSQLNYWQPLGTLYVASSLARAGHEVRFLDGAFFAKKSHPSRLLVNAMAQAGLGWSPVMGQTDPLYRKIDAIVHAEDGTNLYLWTVPRRP